MMALRVIAFIAGLALVATVISSSVRTMVLPRGIPSTLSRLVFLALRKVFRARMGRRADFERQDRIMAFYAPVGLLSLLSAWLLTLIAGYTLLFFGAGIEPFSEAFTMSGSSIFTLGFARGDGLLTTVLSFSAAALGLFILALLITYLPTLHAAFNRRETVVTKLEVRAGSPPSGESMINLAVRLGRLDLLRDVWTEWENWFADVEETHTSFAVLGFFRSPQPEHSWITAAGAVLDGAALRLSVVDAPDELEAHVCIRSGFLALRHIANYFGIPNDPDPAPDDPITVTREEFDAACDRLAKSGVPLKADRDQAWRDFAGWRVNYDTVLVMLCRLVVAPPAPWSSDRATEHWAPKVFRRDHRPGAKT
jgi:hypothetical protein